ncbi:flippase-like domain-containing protein [bacterium]|nr:flippase-like domain-containing protein [bacterium]
MKQLKPWHKILIIIVVLLIFFFIGKAFYHNWQKIPFDELKFNPFYLGLSFFLLSGSIVITSLSWSRVLFELGENMPLVKALQIHSVSQMGRYVPGKFMAPLGKIYLAKKIGIPASTSLVSIIFHTIFVLFSALILFAISLGFLARQELPDAIYLGLLLIPLCIIALHPRINSIIINQGLKILKKPPIKVKFKYTRSLRILCLYILSWASQGGALFFLIKSFFSSLDLLNIFPIIGIQSIAWVVGFISFFVPGGIGVREGILSFFLKFYVPVSIGVMSALLYRIWTIIIIVIFALVFSKGLLSSAIHPKINIKDI